MSIKSIETFDFLFIGMGAANCLLLLKLHEENLLVDKKIAIIEPNSKIVNDRNFCFWSTEEELLTLKIEDLVSSKWQKIKVADREYQNISPLYYYHVKGIDLYNKAREILKNLDVKKYNESFEGEPILNANTFEINLINGKIKAGKVFDSRPPVFESAKKNQSHILQSFYGWEINTKDYIFDTSSVVMMDFNIPQNNFCQFMYILPFSENTALFEVTRFGKEKISKDEAVHLLTDYLKQLGFSYQILDEEVGVIPMSSLKITDTNYGENWILTGARANMIKPTTGYAFHNMVIDACNLAESISKQLPIKREKHNARFNFYDHLLLKIIEETPQQGKKIFQKLFNNTPINEVLLFLSEKSTLRKEFTIFSKLPIITFLRVAFKDILFRISRLQPTYFASILTIVFLLLHTLKQDEVIWASLGFGFLAVGLPHGAVDHLTNNSIQNLYQYIKFIISYIVKGLILGVFWVISPDFALLAFIAFSAWHFGQADIREWKLKQGVNAYLWGLTVLSMILVFHPQETITVLYQIKDLQMPQLFELLTSSQLFWLKLSISLFSILFAVLNKSKWMLIVVFYLILSSFLPLLISFGIYFIFQHSMHGWKHLKNDLKINSNRLWIKSLPFSIGGAVIFLIFLLLNNKDYFGIFFIVLSCISMPHVLSMHNFYKKSVIKQ